MKKIIFALIGFVGVTFLQADVQDNVAQQTPTPTELSTVQTSPGSGNRVIINKIVARVNGINILLSELTMPRISKEGGMLTLDEAIIEELLYQRAAEMHMLPTAADVERHFTSFKIQNDLTKLSDQDFEDQLKDQLKRNDFTLKMYKSQLARMIAAENVKRAEISERVVVTAQEVEEYYNGHPKHTKEEYHLKIYTAPGGEGDTPIIPSDDKAWQDLGWVAKKDMNKQFEVVFSFKPGDVSDWIKNEKEQMQLIKLIDVHAPRLKTVEERYSSIERLLQNQKKKTFLENFEKELKEKASIVYL